MKRKNEINIGPLIKEEWMTGSEWNTKEEKIQQDIFWSLGPGATHQITRHEIRTDPDNIKIDKIIKIYYRYYLPKRDKYN